MGQKTYRRTAFHVADKDHPHHRLMRLGHTTRRTVAILWLWTALLSALASASAIGALATIAAAAIAAPAKAVPILVFFKAVTPD